MIEVHNVTQHYGVRPVLQGVDLTINGGELVALMGPNGMGKSTLLGVMAGVLWPQQGYVEIDGIRRRSSVENELTIRRKVAYLPDDPWIPPARTGREYILAVGRLYDVPDERLLNHAERLLDLFHLSENGDSPIGGYSTGQKKKIALASALITEADILLLDEPFSGGLDPSGILALKSLLQRLAARPDVTIVAATPVPQLMQELAHRIVVLESGKIIAHATTDELRQQSGIDGSLEEVLERILQPETLAKIDAYFDGESK